VGHGHKSIIRAEVPLRELVGYSTQLRSLTAGQGGLSMEFAAYTPVGPLLQKKIQADPSSA
jgi:elongation factor G